MQVDQINLDGIDPEQIDAEQPRETSHTSPTEEEVIVFEGVGKQFVRDGELIWALKGLDLRIRKGEMVAIVGQTGCGKSTAFNLLLGLYPPSQGRVVVQGRDPYADFDSFQGKIAVVFQDDRLLPWRTAEANVALGLEYQGVGRNERHQIARQWLERLGLKGSEGAYPYQMSGGMRQRVGIARCFALNPDIILCDESFSALDELTAEQLRAEFVKLVREEHKTGVFITHSIEEALTIGERVVVFRAPGHVAGELEVPENLTPDERATHRDQVRALMNPAATSQGGE